ncbi:MAG TPA: amino acid adenylation domain-containing protein, partial [Thermoanaerobaculia bacterium]|nr:amino acid adenylation domain-containing protein [Thermoanaerobaculia bacterium]
DVAALRWAMDEIVRRHETLRTTFEEIDGLPMQRIASTGALDLPLVDLAALRGEVAEVRRLASGLALRPFDLARGPLFRGLLVRLGEGDHAVLLALHHVISDGWSIGVFLRELSALYTARLAGRPSPLPSLPVQYADFAVWQRGWLQGKVLARQVGYWREALAGLAPLELPADRPRPATPGSRGGAVAFSLGEEPSRAVRDLGRQQGATLFMVLLAAFQALLQRYTGEDDIAVGTPTAGRNRREIEGLIGFFINMLVLRGDLSGDPGFRALVDQTRETALGAFAHQDVPFEKVVEELQPARDLGRNPLFQVGFQVAHAPAGGVGLPGLELADVPRADPAAKVDLNLSFGEGKDGIGGLLEYDADLFEATTVLRLGTHLRRLLESALADPERPLSTLPLLTPWEEHQLLAEWNDAAAEEAETSFLQRFEGWTRRTPGATALVFEDEQLTYGELAERADRLAAALQEMGVGPEVLVGLCLEASLEILVAILAVWKAGGAYLPLDPSYPRDRLAFMLEDSGVSLVLTEERWRHSLPEREALQIINLTHIPSPMGGGASPLGRGEVGSGGGQEGGFSSLDALAYVIYTSGSTGRPKGVAVSRRGLGNLARAHADLFGVGPGGRVLQIASFSFDASVAKLVGALGTGAALVQARRETWQPGPDLARALARAEVSFSVMVPPLLSAVPPAAASELPALSLLATAGEACPAELVERWAPGRRFWNLYGPTEMTVLCVGGEALPTGKPADRSPDMGRPFPNCRAHVLDRNLQPVPVGVAGELVLQGPGLARGYLGRPELTAERFVPDPWAALWDEPGARLYRTGDLVRRRAGGRLDFLGRVDQQVKIRGFRIELGEIEAVLREHPEVSAAAATVRQGGAGDRRLVAFAVPRGAPEADRLVREAMDHLRRRLPDYMVPSAVTLLDRLPLTPNGKLDRKALDRIAVGECRGAQGFVPPRTPVEQVLAGIWAEVLKIGRVGAGDDFFALSGNSLLAAQVASRVRQTLGVELPLRRLFERATLGELAREIETARGSRSPEDEVPLPPIERQPRDRPLPASLYQEFGWKLQGGPVGALLNMPQALRIQGPLDLGALLAGLREMVRRHEELRSVFVETGGGLFLEAGAASRVPLPVIDLSALPAERREGLAHRLAAEEAARPFDLSRAPGFRAQVLRLGERDHSLLFTMHHLISDGASFAVFRRELWTLAGAFSRGLPSPLPEPPLQPGDFAWWQRRQATAAIDAQVEWWARRLAGRPPALGLPGDRPRPAVVGPEALADYAVFPAELVAGLRALAQASGCTVGMVLTTAVQVLMHRYTGEVDLVIGTVFAGRNRPELTELISLFLNTLPVRSDLSGRPAFRDLLLQTRDAVLEAYAHQDAPFPRLIAELYPGQAPDRQLLFRVILNLLDFEFAGGPPAEEAGPGDLRVEPMERSEVWATYDFALDVEGGEDFLLCHLTAAADLVTPEGLAAIKLDLVALLEQIAAAPELPLDNLLPEPRHRPV